MLAVDCENGELAAMANRIAAGLTCRIRAGAWAPVVEQRTDLERPMGVKTKPRELTAVKDGPPAK